MEPGTELLGNWGEWYFTLLDEHTVEMLRDTFGVDDARIADLMRTGVFGAAYSRGGPVAFDGLP